MSGPNPPGPETFGEEPGGDPVGEEHTQDVTTDTGFSQAYSAPESEQFSSGPYVAADPALYDYDAYESATGPDDQPPTPRWPWGGRGSRDPGRRRAGGVRVAAGVPQPHQPPGRPGHHDLQAAAGAGRDHQDAAAPPADVRGSAAPTADRDGHGHIGTPASAPSTHQRGASASARACAELDRRARGQRLGAR